MKRGSYFEYHIFLGFWECVCVLALEMGVWIIVMSVMGFVWYCWVFYLLVYIFGSGIG